MVSPSMYVKVNETNKWEPQSKNDANPNNTAQIKIGRATSVYAGSVHFLLFGVMSLHLSENVLESALRLASKLAWLTSLLRGRVALMWFTCRMFHLNQSDLY